jgi:hypothetical protein
MYRQLHPALSSTVLVIALALAVSLVPGCTRRATQLMLVVESDLAPGSYACIGIEVVRLTSGAAVLPSQYVSFNVPVQTGVPFSLGVLPPGGDAAVRVEIRAEARAVCLDPNATPMVPPPVVRTVLRAGFAPEQTLRLPVFLAALCNGVSCEDGESCNPSSGVCEPVVEQMPSDLMPIRPGDELSDAAVPNDGAAAHDANLIGGQCPLEIDDYTGLADAPPRVFGLAITEPGNEWVVLYSDAGSLHAIAYPYDRFTSRAVPTWTVAGDADAIAVEALASGNELLALVNPSGSSELVRYVGPLDGAAPVRSSVGIGRLVQRGRHSARFGARMAVVVERDAGVAVVAIGVSDGIQDLYVSPTPVDLAVGNTASGDLIIAITGTACELRSFDRSGVMTGTHAVAIAAGETCRPRAVATLVDGNFALLYVHSTQLRLSLSTASSEMSLRLSEGAHVPVVAALLGNDDTYRVAWSDVYDYPGPPDPGPEEPGIRYQTSFAIGSSGSEYTDHGDATTDHDLTRWERLGERTGLVMVPRNGFLFRSLCRPTPE